MIITEKYALKLIREGKAIISNITTNGPLFYAVLNRLDKQRTDHFEIDEKRWEKLKKKWGEK